jgi:DNA polymerase V
MIGLVDGNNFFVSCERTVDPRLVGRPVAVLSNNDGCCVSRSNEFKALGIPMGTPYFQLKDREASGELVFRSSNYELYGDISRRILLILRDEALDVEQYSIDEAFVVPPNGRDLEAYGGALREKILKWTGIPCGVGFAPTKTLAKIANHIGKKTATGVFVLPDDPTEILAGLPADEVWGVGRRLLAKLRAERIFTAKDLRDADDGTVRRVGGVVLLRTAMELRGIVCLADRDYGSDPDSVSCSRSFGEPVTTLEALAESIASFTAQAAVKLRKHGLLASGVNVYAQYGSACEGGWTERTVVFDHPTDATNQMLAAIRGEIASLFLPGLRYRKSGLVFFGLEKADSVCQLDLFTEEKRESSKLYRAIDLINAKYGRGKVFSAAEGVGVRAWKMKREKLSRCATTNWNELLIVR